MTAERTTTTAGAPFDDADADIVLRSCDNVDFLVSKVILKVASPFFADMFTLRQPTSDEPALLTRPVIDMEEDAATLDCLLRLCYPLPERPRLDDLNTVEQVLRSALKYDIDAVTRSVKHRLAELASDKPHGVFAVACRLRLESSAAIAAQRLRDNFKNTTCKSCRLRVNTRDSLSNNFFQVAMTVYSAQLADLSAACFHGLVKYIRVGGRPTNFCNPPNIYSSHNTFFPYLWPNHAMFTLSNYDLALQSRQDGIYVPIHQSVLLLMAATEILKLPRDDTFKVPIIHIPERGPVLQAIAILCYDCYVGNPPLQQLHQLAHVAEKYKLNTVIARLRRLWATSMTQNPVLAFFVAASHGWTVEAEQAARHIYLSRRSTATEYFLWMALYSAKVYFTLLKYIDECADVERKALSLKDSSIFLAFGTWNRVHIERFLSTSPTLISELLTVISQEPIVRPVTKEKWEMMKEETAWQAARHSVPFSHKLDRLLGRSTSVRGQVCRCACSAEDERFAGLAAFVVRYGAQDQTALTLLSEVKIDLPNAS
ncbi:hypothetical protein K474DRAFT_1712159 [Panus rudis PR-1116 ss-1]|nr:hypothetical protein K474DRAFT_1712159 [Panus rudis PR-1116 ss-1]